MKRRSLVCVLAFCAAHGHAADLPLGLVDSAVDAQHVVLRFESDPHLAPGSMLAIYGLGVVEKHPLTKEVIIEGRKLVAKVQLIGGDPQHPIGRVLWPTVPVTIEPGDDAIPLPGEAAPNAPPVETGTPTGTSMAIGGTTHVSFPISDPDGDAMVFRWSLSGPPGRCGRLDARTTTTPSIDWTAPGMVGQAELAVSVLDSAGHEVSFTSSITASALDDPRHRDLRVFARWGDDAERPLSALCHLTDGWWCGVTRDDGKLVRIHPGWLQWPWVGGSDKDAPSGSAVAGHGSEIDLLESKNGRLDVIAIDGSQRRSLTGLSKPSSVVLDSDGTTFIADQSGGGVMVFEADGRFRCRLGRIGDGDEDFADLTRLALGTDGTLYAVDAKHRRIQRFDHQQHRLPGWSLSGDPSLQPIDIACHPRGLLVLLSNGSIQIYDGKGLAREAMPPLSEAGLADDVGKPSGLCVDGWGEIMVVYPDHGLLARYSAKGTCTGVRGPGLRDRDLWAADGGGRLYALNEDGNLEVVDAEGWLVSRLSGIGHKRCAGLAACSDGQWVELLDRKSKSVVRVNLVDRKESMSFGQPGKNNGQFDDPIALAVDDAGRTYVLDQGLYRVSVFDPKGGFLFAFGSYGKGASDLKEPLLLAVSPSGDAAYVYDDYHYEIKKFALDMQANSAAHVTNSGGKGDGPGQLRSLTGIGCDRLGLIYLIDKSRGDVQAIDFRGNSAVSVCSHRFGDFGVRSVVAIALSPDGQLWLSGDGTMSGSRWMPK